MAFSLDQDQSSLDDEVRTSLYKLLPNETDASNNSQLQLRLKILTSWFGDLPLAAASLSNSTVLEIGCGQGDMTVPLAHFAGEVLAVDPASLDYGSPETLGQAQNRISKSELGRKIQWVRSDPIEYLKTLDVHPDFVVLAHSIFYIASETYFSELLQSLKSFSSGGKDGKETRLLIAEWGMRTSTPAAEAHVLAAKAQAINPLTDGNVRTIVPPERIKKIATDASWKIEREAWIEAPDVQDGEWELRLTRTMAYEEKSIPEGKELTDMELAVEKLHGDIKEVRSMDVWTGVFVI
jgi:ubiquinone/menaquinone biosynthesis C-methylase UbiE